MATNVFGEMTDLPYEMAAAIAESMLEHAAGADQRELERYEALERRQERWAKLDLNAHDVSVFWGLFTELFGRFVSIRQFCSKIGFIPQVLDRLWLRYGPELAERHISPLDILMLCNWLAEHPSFDNIALAFGCSRSQAHKVVLNTLYQLWELLDEISWYPLVWHPAESMVVEGSLFNNVTFVLDGIECKIAKPVDRRDEESYYSTKKGAHSIKYQTATNISSGRLMYYSGGIPGAIHDRTLLKHSTLPHIIPEGQYGLADKGYECLYPNQLLYLLKPSKPEAGHPLAHVKSFTFEERLYNRCISALRIEVERVNGRLKRFAILEEYRTRCKLSHHVVFGVICNLVNIWMELCPMRRAEHPLMSECPVARPERSFRGLP